MNIKYLLTLPNRLRHRRGFGVQSPWAYEFVRDVVEEKSLYYAFDDMADLTASLGLDVKPSLKCHYELLFRIVNSLKPSYVLQAGIGDALNACYMSLPDKETSCYAVSHSFSEMSKRLLEDFSVKCMEGDVVELCRQIIESQGKIGILDFPLTEKYETLYEYAVGNVNSDSLFILEEIDSEEGRLIWNKILDDERTAVTFDLGSAGLAFFDKRRCKQNFTL